MRTWRCRRCTMPARWPDAYCETCSLEDFDDEPKLIPAHKCKRAC